MCDICSIFPLEIHEGLWPGQELRPMMGEVLSPKRIKQDGLFNSPYVEGLKGDHLRGIANI